MKIFKISEILEELEESIIEKKPFSLIRFGDGLIKCVHSIFFNDHKQLLSICKREGFPENRIVTILELCGKYAKAANFIDCPSVYFIPNIFWEKCEKGLKAIEKTELKMKMGKDLYSRSEFYNDRFCNPEINYLSCIRTSGKKNLLDILKNKKICCISTYSEINKDISFDIIPFQIVKRFENQYENSFEKVINFIKKEANNFDIFLVSAGELGRIYSGYIKECGGRSFDFGSMIDYYQTGYFTDSLADFISPNPENKLEFLLNDAGLKNIKVDYNNMEKIDTVIPTTKTPNILNLTSKSKNIEKIDITMTATKRPNILNSTLESFCKNILTDKSRYRLIINIDPIGERVKSREILRIAKKYFDNVTYKYSKTPGFTKAVIWCWRQVTAKYVFHLEDDWTLSKPIKIDDMINIFEKNLNLASLRLNKDNLRSSRHGNKFGFVYAPKLSLNPSLFRGKFIKEVHSLMKITRNPEKQLRCNKSELGQYIGRWKDGIYVKDGYNSIVNDIGRSWMKKSKFTKKTGFLLWRAK